MRKTIVLCLLMFVMGVMMTSSLATEPTEVLPGGKNLIDLNTFYRTEFDNFGHSKDHSIYVNVGQTYTLVMDYDYVAHCFDMLEEFEYRNISTLNPEYVEYVFDDVNERVYAEFVPTENYISIYSLPVPRGVDTMNYHVILYEGDYASFSGFEPYVEPSFIFEESGALEIDVDHMLSFAEIEALVVAKDPYGSMIEKTVVSSTFEEEATPGSYEVIFEARSNLLARRYVLNVTVIDQTAPVISGPETLTYDISKKPTRNVVKEQYSALDNVDGIVDITFGTDTYTYASKLGTFLLELKAKDSSGNETILGVKVTLVDQTAPNLKGPLDLYVYTTDVPLSEADILSMYSAIDVVDPACVVTLEDEMYVQTQTPGIYEVTISSTDIHGNTAERMVYIHVIDNRGPSFDVDELYIETTTNNMMNTEHVVSQFINHMQTKQMKVENVNVIYNEYESHETQTGDYYVYLNYDLDGESYTSRVLINVSDTPFVFSPYYLFGLVPVLGLATYFIYKKRRG